MAAARRPSKKRLFTNVAAALAFYGLAGVTVDNDYIDKFISGDKCGGTVRWDIKTMADEDSRAIDVKSAKFTTIEKISELDVEMPEGGRKDRQPFEMKVYTIVCTIADVKKEGDEDLHLVMEHDGWEMVGEIVFPYCENIKHTGRKRTFEKVFRDFAPYRKRSAYKDKLWLVTGVAFMDHDHDQTGGAANGLELHPILSIEPIKTPDP
jgi:hypothetical protein